MSFKSYLGQYFVEGEGWRRDPHLCRTILAKDVPKRPKGIQPRALRRNIQRVIIAQKQLEGTTLRSTAPAMKLVARISKQLDGWRRR